MISKSLETSKSSGPFFRHAKKLQKPHFILVGVFTLLALFLVRPISEKLSKTSLVEPKVEPSGLSKTEIKDALKASGIFSHFSNQAEILLPGESTHIPVKIDYGFDLALQEQAEEMLEAYRPDFAAVVAMDPSTGQILSMVSFVKNSKNFPEGSVPLALKATFPSASVFKVVTAAAAIAEAKFNGETVIPFNGRNHTLYKGNVLKTAQTRWTRHMTLREAFARSVNTVFGKIGVFTVGPQKLKQYAENFAFNEAIETDLPVEEGKAAVEQDPWLLAEAASGYTQENKMSPLHGALIAATVVNDGVMMEPYVISRVMDQQGKLLYRVQPKEIKKAVSPATAQELRGLMRETVLQGTSKKSFRGFFKGIFRDLDVGGKTGSLSGTEPRGKYDWFVGYAGNGKDKLALSVLTINQNQWRVKSSFVARRLIETYFRDKVVPR